jgi:hypothetical protein
MVEYFVLVEMLHGHPHPAMNALAPTPENSIKRVIRVHATLHRANEDLELLQEVNPASIYAVHQVGGTD